MHTRRALIGALVWISILMSGFAEGLLKLPGQWVPFLERLEKDEFLAVEHALGGALSDSAPDLLIYRAGGRQIVQSISLAQSSGQDFRLEVVTLWGEPVPLRKVIRLPADIARRLLSVMELCLTTQLYPPTGEAFRYPGEGVGPGAFWINRRIDKTTSIAGVVLIARCNFGRDSVFPFFDLIDQIMRLAEADRIEKGMLTELDLSISALRMSYPAKR